MANGKLFTTLGNYHITDGPSAQEIILSLSPERALDILGECNSSINTEARQDTQTSLFTFFPSGSLAGSPSPCSNIQCRMENASNLALFSSLYCDRLILPNMFNYYYHYKNDIDKPFSSKDDEEWFLKRFANDLSVLFQYKPLLDKDIATIHGTETVVCQGCQRIKLASSGDFEDRLGSIYESMKPRLSKKIEFYRKDKDVLQIYDSTNYTGGSFLIDMSEKYQRQLNKTSKRYPYKLKPNEIIRSGALDLVLQDTLYDLMEKNYYPDLRNVTFLSNRQIDADLIEASTKNEQFDNPIRSSNLYHSLPFLQNILLEDILKIRADENRAFIAYRDALTKAIKEHDATPDELAHTYITPALNQITNTIQSNKRYYRAKAGKTVLYSSVVATAGAIASNLLNAPLSPEIVGAAGALLSTPSILPDIAESNTISKEVRNDPYYFLWKVQKKSHH